MNRLRQNKHIRDWVSETKLSPASFIQPYFVVEGKGIKAEIKSMPGIFHLSIDNLLKDIERLKDIKSVLLFGVPDSKDNAGYNAYKKDGVVQKAVSRIKKERKDLIAITDVCLCGYTLHGHCGIAKKSKIKNQKSNIMDNEATVKVLSKIALSHAEAGADFVAPSAMADGQVAAIRNALDKSQFKNTGILAYSAKYASFFYGPFRDALDSTPKFGDRKAYQMDYRNSDEALREIRQDIDEGADIVMVKPALAYLDVIYKAKQGFNVPIAAYNVSAEYAMVKAYCQRIEDRGERAELEKNLALEILTSIKRAGADFIITYWAKDVVKWVQQ